MTPMTAFSSEAAAGQFMRRTERSLTSSARPSTAAAREPSRSHQDYESQPADPRIRIAEKADGRCPKTWSPGTTHYTISRTGDWAFESRPARRPRGRAAPLSPEVRKAASALRMVGPCENCRKRKVRCDLDTPCKACVRFYKDGLNLHPCIRANGLVKPGSADIKSAVLAVRP